MESVLLDVTTHKRCVKYKHFYGGSRCLLFMGLALMLMCDVVMMVFDIHNYMKRLLKVGDVVTKSIVCL